MRREAETRMQRALFTLCLLVAPAILFGIELFHPANFTAQPGMYQFLSHPEHGVGFRALAYPGPAWWFVMHMIQTPMIGLVAIGLFLLSVHVRLPGDRLSTACRWAARAAIFVFVIYYTVLDAIGGIGLGRMIEIVQRLQAEGKLTQTQVDGIAFMLDQFWTDRFVGGLGSLISRTGSLAVFTASILLAAGLARARAAGWVTIVALVGFGWELQTTHAAPHGPAAFALLIVAALGFRMRLGMRAVDRAPA